MLWLLTMINQMLPMTLKNAILTPPSSEQLSSNQGQTFDTTSISGQNNSATTGVDSFLTEENLKHLRKNSSYLECENPLCRQENLREHFHCYEDPCEGKF
ncbi:Transcription factor castor [Eumeta japonica]|uniref:Transcription factor castor n=1 Tax=Eumeta variegata TaxID=151549 RepID=A0A4C1SXV3_EUMVA|nr:Transcription factor castor [Eumeta japonica]